MRIIRVGICVAVVVVTVFSSVATAQVMQSNNYQIQSDSINVGGGFSVSDNYIQESTVGEIATGPSESNSYNLYAGYQQMQEVYLALAVSGNVAMDQAINGVTGGVANGSTTLTATTDSVSGYELTIAATDSPSMQANGGAYSIADYVPDGAVPDLHFATGANESHFSYSPFGTDVVTRFQTNGSACGVSGSASTTACWDGLSTTPVIISSRTSSNHPTGTVTDVYFKVGIGNNVVQVGGVYVATSTVTLLPR